MLSDTFKTPATLALPCVCAGTCSVVLVTEFDGFKDEPQTYYFSFFIRASEASLRNRMRRAWGVLRGKDPWLHDITLNPSQMAELRDFIDACHDRR